MGCDKLELKISPLGRSKYNTLPHGQFTDREFLYRPGRKLFYSSLPGSDYVSFQFTKRGFNNDIPDYRGYLSQSRRADYRSNNNRFHSFLLPEFYPAVSGINQFRNRHTYFNFLPTRYLRFSRPNIETVFRRISMVYKTNELQD